MIFYRFGLNFKTQPMKNLIIISVFFILFSACKKECAKDNISYFVVKNNTSQSILFNMVASNGTTSVATILPFETHTIEARPGNYTYIGSGQTTGQDWTGSISLNQCDSRNTTLQ